MNILQLLFDRFTITLTAVVVLATVLPAQGAFSVFFDGLTHTGIALLFFLHGARLSRRAIIDGAMHWRLHLLVFVCTFALFPVLGLVLGPVLRPVLGDALWLGMLYLCLLPGTVQSAIAFTSIARGNIPAAVCAASASSLVGIVLTPLLAGAVLGTAGTGVPVGEAILKIGMQLLLPFAAGHALRPWIGGWVARRQRALRLVDQGSILLVVYTAFGAAVLDGLWRVVPASALAQLVLCCLVLLALVLVATTWLARVLGFNVEDEITIVFCGSKKSMATGVPMAQIIFSDGAAGLAILPLMVFHQIQLMVCAVLARRYAERGQLAPSTQQQ